MIYSQPARLEIVPKVRAKSANERQFDPCFICLTTQQNLAEVDSDFKSLDYRQTTGWIATKFVRMIGSEPNKNPLIFVDQDQAAEPRILNQDDCFSAFL